MKFYLRIVLFYASICLSSKRKYKFINISPCETNVGLNINEDPNNFNCDSFKTTVSQFEQSRPKLSKLDNSDENYHELYENIDFKDLTELSKDDLDNILDEIKSNYSELREKRQVSKIRRRTYENKEECSIKEVTSKDGHLVNYECSEVVTEFQDSTLTSQRTFITQPTLENIDITINKLKVFSENFVARQIDDSYKFNHIRKLKFIEEALLILDNYQINNNTYLDIFNPICDKEIIKGLEELILKFEKKPKFNREYCDKFLADFNKKVFVNMHSFIIRNNLESLTDHCKIVFFYIELNKLYRFVNDVSELLTLGSLCSVKRSYMITYMFHVINLCCENSRDKKNQRFFILCMISKAFNLIYGDLFDVFLIPVYEIKCNKNRHDLYYFLLEFANAKRRSIKISKKTESIIRDREYFKIVLLSYLYQHLSLLKHSNVCFGNIKPFINFIDRVKVSQDCIGCLLNEYLTFVKQFHGKNISDQVESNETLIK